MKDLRQMCDTMRSGNEQSDLSYCFKAYRQEVTTKKNTATFWTFYYAEPSVSSY